MLVALAAPALAAYALLAGCAAPLKLAPLERASAPLVTDAHLELARRYAPIVLHAVHPEKGRQDIPTRVDFDRDLRGDNAWESFPRYELPPVVYYAVLETGTHWFLTYHLFHPRDWSYARWGFHETHENDGENLQVVVRKTTGAVELLFAQAHYRGKVYAAEGVAVGDGARAIAGPILLLDDAGRPDPRGRRAAVYVQAYGHGIYGAIDGCADVVVEPDGTARFADAGLVLRPARADEIAREPDLEAALAAGEPVPYHLESTTAKLWPGVRDGTLLGAGGLLDGTVSYRATIDGLGPLELPVPRYYEADRFSGPFGPDRGIAPFAVDFSFCEGEVGALFYDPAGRYRAALDVPEPWSLAYVDYPFAPAPGAAAASADAR